MNQLNKLPINFQKTNLLKRIYSINIEDNYLYEYLDKVRNISVRDIEYIPYFRFLMAREFEQIFKIKDTLLNVLNERETSAILINCNHCDINEDPHIKISTAISHLLGIPNIDPLSGKHYGIFTIKDTDLQVPNLLRPYEAFKMHTDGAYMKKVPDWIFFMKMEERRATGGQSKLLHIDDWNDFDYFYNHPINKNTVKFLSHPDSKTAMVSQPDNDENSGIYSSLLNINDLHKSIRFVDRFIHPKNLEEAEFIYEFQNSLENSKGILEIDIPVGCILIVNNHRWLHGRQQFGIDSGLTRKLMRQRGNWA